MVGKRCCATSCAETANTVFQVGVTGWFNRAVLIYIRIYIKKAIRLATAIALEARELRARRNPIQEAQGKEGDLLTLHTTLEHLRHSPTISRAHFRTLALVNLPDCCRCWLTERRTDFTLSGIAAPRLSISERVSIYSFSQHSVCLTNSWRKGSRFARNWRHVRDSAWRVFRSTDRPISLTILLYHRTVCTT